LGGPAGAAAEPAVGVLPGSSTIVVFDTATPGTVVNSVPVTGFGSGERLVGIDFRYHPIPAPGAEPPPSQLFGVAVTPGATTNSVRLYSIDLIAGVATPVGSGFVMPPGGNRYGIDFNPAVDRIRVVHDGDENFRINPNNGTLAGDDSNLTPAGERVSAVAYDRVEPGPPREPTSTTAFAIGVTTSRLLTLGGFNASVSANSGMLLNPKPLSVLPAFGSSTDLDISPTGIAYAVLVDAGTSLPGLYGVDLNSGVATPLGQLPAALEGLAIVPQSALPPVPAVPDRTPPTIALVGLRAKMSFAAFLRGVTVRVTPSEAASIRGQLLGAAKKRKPKPKGLVSFTRVLATASLPLAAGQRSLKLKPKKKKVGRPAKAFRVRLRITATDAAGNAAATTAAIRVSAPGKRR
jgi:Domain of unknown function (DUF4394)